MRPLCIIFAIFYESIIISKEELAENDKVNKMSF
jgi:preprotein translocase subunit SecY